MDLSNYSDFKAKTISKIISDDNGFHSAGFVAEYPFAGIVSISDDGIEIVSKFAQADVDTANASYNFELSFSDEMRCWFVKMSSGGDVYNGVLQFNVVKNYRGGVAFAFLNDNKGETLSDITNNIQFCDILILEK